MAFDEITVDCKSAPTSARSDAGVAGTGILLAFIITAALALLLSAFIVFSEVRPNQRLASPRTILRKMLNGLSDQMCVLSLRCGVSKHMKSSPPLTTGRLLEGILIQAVGLARVNDMIPYHFFIIWMLSLLSTATNFASLLALVQDYKRDWVLRWVRQLAMFVNMVLGIVFGIFVLEVGTLRAVTYTRDVRKPARPLTHPGLAPLIAAKD